MEKILKTVGIIIGSLVVGVIVGWLFDQVGVSTPVTVAVILAAYAAYESIKKQGETKKQ